MTTRRRKDIRLKGFDYSGNAWYFVTVCCDGHRKLFGEVVDGQGRPLSELEPAEIAALACLQMRLSPAGEHCERVLRANQEETKQIRIGDYVVMPNHVHFTAIAEQGEGKPISLACFVRNVKAAITHAVRGDNPGIKVWQKGYYDHVIRDDADCERILDYIANNPAQWASDKYFS